MLTKVRLYGVMGKKFGREWELSVSSPAEALRLIEANKPGLKRWVIENKETYANYRVVCVKQDGSEEELGDDDYGLSRQNLKEIRFAPIVTGASGVVRVVVGVLLIAASFIPGIPGSTYLFKIGVSMLIGGVVEMLSPRPKTRNRDSEEDAKSYYFDGPVNTQQQGNPVPLIYGRMLVGAQPISASITIDEVSA